MRPSRLSGSALFIAMSTAPLVARATPRPLPFTYTADTLGAGETEIENYVDLTPVKALDPNGVPATYWHRSFKRNSSTESPIASSSACMSLISPAPRPTGRRQPS